MENENGFCGLGPILLCCHLHKPEVYSFFIKLSRVEDVFMVIKKKFCEYSVRVSFPSEN